MKRYNNLYEKICSFENLYLAYLKARECKRYKSEILKFSYHLENNLLNLRKELLDQNYKHGSYRTFIVNDSKKRIIKAAPFRDRVVHHALCNLIEPIFDRGFIYDSYACRKNKGTHKTIKRLESFIRSISDHIKNKAIPEDVYCLQCDISKYFANIDHEILIKLIEKKVKDKKTLWLISKIVESSYKCKFLENLLEFRLVGIPIGNLTSQLFANIYLNELDQFIKHKLHKKYYLRYMDDFIILNNNKKELHQARALIQDFLKNKLKLKFHPKKANIFLAKRGINFLGYIIFKNYKLLRKSTVKRFIKRVKILKKKINKKLITGERYNRSIQSWLAYAKFGNSWRLRKNLAQNYQIINSLLKSNSNKQAKICKIL